MNDQQQKALYSLFSRFFIYRNREMAFGRPLPTVYIDPEFGQLDVARFERYILKFFDSETLQEAQEKLNTGTQPKLPESTIPDKNWLDEQMENMDKPVEKVEKPIYVVPKKDYQPKVIKLTPEEKVVLQNLVTQAKTNEKFTEELVTRISTKLENQFTPEEIQVIATSVATNFVEKLKALPDQIPDELTELSIVAPIAAMQDPEVLKQFDAETQKVLISTALDIVNAHNDFNKIGSTLIVNDVGPRLANNFYPQVSPKEEAEHYEVTTEKKEDAIYAIRDERVKVYAQTKYELIRKLDQQYPGAQIKESEINDLVKQLVGLHSAYQYLGFATTRFGNIQHATASIQNNSPLSLMNIIPGNLSFSLIKEGEQKFIKVGFLVGNKVIPLSGTALKVAGLISKTGVVTTTTKSIVSKAVSTGIVKLLGEGVGSIIGGPIGTAVGAIIGWIVDQVVSKLKTWIIKHKKEFAIFLGLLLGAIGLFAGIPVLLAAGLAIAALAAVGGLAAGAGLVVGGFQAVIGGIIGSFALTLATGAIITIIGIPIATAIILFIINSGAMVYPPGHGNTPDLPTPTETSPYLGVQKFATPNKTPNTTGEFEVQYKVIITAKQGPITITSINNEYNVISDNNPPIPTTPTTIFDPYINQVVSTSLTIEYALKLNAQYNDSLVVDTVKVTATTADGKTAEATGVATVMIGNPPIGCFVITNEDQIPSNLDSNLNQGITTLSGEHPVYVSKICSKGPINITYEDTDPGYWGYYKGTNNITLYQGGLGTVQNAEYIVAHEAGHLLAAYAMPNLYVAYLDYAGVKEERPICSYSATTEASEAFAEAIALYASDKAFSCFGGTFQSRYPNHWQFANDIIFQ